ncbi:MAG: methyltransferase domain-containing protein [Elusimicrobia bacterium]|nr:methyltransferase domain-containing protein [Elusimicrobiota bacterium]
MGPRKDAPPRPTSWHRFFGAFLTTVYFVQSVLLAAAPESNFWSERRRSQTAQRRVLALAALPGPSLDATRVTAAWPIPAPESAPIRFSVPPALRQEVARVLEALPAENISVRGLLVPKGPPAAVLVHLQDVHLNPEAQTNLGQAVSSLAAHRLGDLVALEGAFGAVDLAAYRRRPERDAVRSTADYFLRANKISGPVHALVTAADPAPLLIGIDDKDRYNANVAAYLRSAPIRPAVQKEIGEGKAETAALKSKTFSPALAEFDAVVQRRRDGRAGLGEYAQAVTNAAPAGLPQASVRAFLQAFAMEKGMDFGAVERERRLLLESLLPRLTAVQTGQLLNWGASYRLGALSAGAFYARLGDLCRERGVALVRFPSMASYLYYVLAADRLRADDLTRELDALEAAAYRRLAVSPAERALVARDRRFFLAGRLADFALSPTEWREWRSGPAEIFESDVRFQSFADFYREAEARDAAMTAKVLQAVRAQSARHPVLVTGGFHAASMDRRLAEAGWVVIQAVPRLTRVDAAAGSAYLSVFAQERTPLEKLFAGEKLFLTPDPLEGERLLPFAVGAALDSPEAARVLYNAFPRALALDSVERTDSAPGPGLRADFAGGSRLEFAWRSKGDGQRTFVQTPLKRGRTVRSILGALMAAGWLAATGPATPAAPVNPPVLLANPAARVNEILSLISARNAALTPEEMAVVQRLLSMEGSLRALNAAGETQVPEDFYQLLHSVNATLRPRDLILFPNNAPPGFALNLLRILRASRIYPDVYYVEPLDGYQRLQTVEGVDEHGRYAMGFTIVHRSVNRRTADNVVRVLKAGDDLPPDYRGLRMGEVYRRQWPRGLDGVEKVAEDLFESAAVHETEHRLNGGERDAILAEIALGPVPRYKLETVNFMYASRFDEKDTHPYFRAVSWVFSRFCEETGRKSPRELAQWLTEISDLDLRLLAVKSYVTVKGRPLLRESAAVLAPRLGLSVEDVGRLLTAQADAMPAGTANLERYASALAGRWYERYGKSAAANWVRAMARNDAEVFFNDPSPVSPGEFAAYARRLLAAQDDHLRAVANAIFDRAEDMKRKGDVSTLRSVESSFGRFLQFSREAVQDVHRNHENPALPHSVFRAVLYSAFFSLVGVLLPGLLEVFGSSLNGGMEWVVRVPGAWAAYHAGLALSGLALLRRSAGPPRAATVRAFEEEILTGVSPSWRAHVRVDVVNGEALRAEARRRGVGREAAFFGAVTVRDPEGVVVFVHKNLVSSWGPWEWLGGLLRPLIAHHESRRVRHLLTPGRGRWMPLLAVTEPITFLFRRAGFAGLQMTAGERESGKTPGGVGGRAAWWGWAALWATGVFFAVDPAGLQAALPLAAVVGAIRSVSTGARFSTLTVPVNVLDTGSGVRNGRIVTERAVSKIRRLLPDLARAGAGGVYLYNGLYTPSALGARVHTVPTAGEHVIEAGAVKVLVRNYQTKRMIGSARENGRSRAVPLSDEFGNNFSVDMSRWNPAAFDGATNEARWAELAQFTADAHRWGLRVTLDLVPWLSPDALNETNYTWAKDKFEVAGDMATWSDERLLNHYFDHALLRLVKDGKPTRVMVGHFTPGKDQIDPDFSNPDYQQFLIDHLKRLIDAGVDRVRIDMAHRLGTPQKDALWHAWTKVISEAKAHAAARGTRFQFLMESYPEYGNDQWRSDFLRLYPDEQVYEVDPFHAYEALVRGEGDGLNPLRNALETARRERNGRSVVFPSNYDEPSLRNLGGPKAAFLALLLTYERLGVPLMIDLRELSDEEGHNIPQAGGQDAHGDNFRHPFLRQIRAGFRALRRGVARSPHVGLLTSLRDFFKDARRIEILDTQFQNRYFAVGVETTGGDYRIRVFDFFPERGQNDPWVEWPPALMEDPRLARRPTESEADWERRWRDSWSLGGVSGPLPLRVVREGTTERYYRLPIHFEDFTASLTLQRREPAGDGRPANSLVFSLARAGRWPASLWRGLDPAWETAERKAGVLGLALEIPGLLLAAFGLDPSVFLGSLAVFVLAHVFLEAISQRRDGRSPAAAWATAFSQLPARFIALAPYALLPGAPDTAHALAAVVVHLGFDFAVFGWPAVANNPRDRSFERGLRFPYDEESLSRRFGSFHLSARDRFIGRNGRPAAIHSISLMAFPDPNSEVGRGLDALAADFSRQPFAGAFYATPSPNRHLTVRPYAVTPLAPPSESDWNRISAAAAADFARTPPALHRVWGVAIDPNSGRVGVWVENDRVPGDPRGSVTLFSPRRPLTAREVRGLRAWAVRHRFDAFGEWNVEELRLVQGDDSYFNRRLREKTLALSAPRSGPGGDRPPVFQRLRIRSWASLPTKTPASPGAEIVVRPASQTWGMVKSYLKAFDRIPAPLAARLTGVRSAMLLGPGANADEIELLWRRLPHVREIHLVELVPEHLKAQDDSLVQHPDWAVNAVGDPISYFVWRAPMGALPAELNGTMDFVFDHQVLDFGSLGRLGMETVSRSLGRVLRPNGLHLSFIFGSEPALDEYLGAALFRDESVQMALRGAPGVPAMPDVRPAGVSAQAEDFRNLVRGTPAPGVVLSLGFGTGDDERYLARQLPDRRVIATTVRDSELRAARARPDTPGNLVYLDEDMRRGFDAAVGSIQHVYARLSLHYLARPELPGVVRELTRVVAPGGILYLVLKGERDPWALHPSARWHPANEMTSYVDRGQTVFRRFASAADWVREFSEFDYEPLRAPVETFERLSGDDHDSHLITLVFRRRADRAGRLSERTRYKARGGNDSGFNMYLKRAALALAAAAFFATGAPAQTPDPALSLAPLEAPARALVDQGLVKTSDGRRAVERFTAFIAGGGPGTQRVGNFASLPVRFLEELDRLNDGLAKDQLMVLPRGSAGNTTITPLRRIGPSSFSEQVLRATNIPAETQARGVGGEGGFTVRRLSLIYADRLDLKARIVWDVLQLPKGRRNLILPGWDVLIDRQFPMGSAIVSLDAVRTSFEARWVIHEWLHRVGGKERDAILGEFIIAPWLQVTALEVGLMAYAGGPGGEPEPARLAAREAFRLLEKELVPGREPPLTPASSLQALAARGDLDLRRAAVRAWVKAAGRPFFTPDTLALAGKAGLSTEVVSALQGEEKAALPEGTARRAQYENALAAEPLGWFAAQGDSPTARRYLRAVAANGPLGPDAPLTADTVVQLIRRLRAREVDSTFNNALAPLAAERKKLPANSAAAAAHDRGVALAAEMLDNLLAQVRRDHQNQALPLSVVGVATALALSAGVLFGGFGLLEGGWRWLSLLPGTWVFYHGVLLAGALGARRTFPRHLQESVLKEAARSFRAVLGEESVTFSFEEGADEPGRVHVAFVPRDEVVRRARAAAGDSALRRFLAGFFVAASLRRADGEGVDVYLTEGFARPVSGTLRGLPAMARRLVWFHEAERARRLLSPARTRVPLLAVEPFRFGRSVLAAFYRRVEEMFPFLARPAAVPAPGELGSRLARSAVRGEPQTGMTSRALVAALDRLIPVESLDVGEILPAGPRAEALAAQRREFVEAFRRQWAASTQRPLSLNAVRSALPPAVFPARSPWAGAVRRSESDPRADHLVILPPTDRPDDLRGFVEAALRASRGRRTVFAVVYGPHSQSIYNDVVDWSRRINFRGTVSVTALPPGAVDDDESPVLRLGVVARELKGVAPSLISVPTSFSIDTTDVPEGPFRTAVFLLIDALLRAAPLRLVDLEIMDRTARAIATSA